MNQALNCTKKTAWSHSDELADKLIKVGIFSSVQKEESGVWTREKATSSYLFLCLLYFEYVQRMSILVRQINTFCKEMFYSTSALIYFNEHIRFEAVCFLSFMFSNLLKNDISETDILLQATEVCLVINMKSHKCKFCNLRM